MAAVTRSTRAVDLANYVIRSGSIEGIKAADVEAVVKELFARRALEYIVKFSWSHPPSKGISHMKKFVLAHIGAPNVMDVGCGKCYISWKMMQKHMNVMAIDLANIKEPGRTNWPIQGDFFIPNVILCKNSEEVQSLVRVNAPNYALLMSWAPPDETMSSDMLTTYDENGGKAVILFGEYRGRTGDRRTFDILDKGWVRHYVPYNAWPHPYLDRKGVRDGMYLYTKREAVERKDEHDDSEPNAPPRPTKAPPAPCYNDDDQEVLDMMSTLFGD